MRWFGITIAVLMAATAHAAPASNPAFLGITMNDVPGGGGCQVSGVTKNSAAQDGGVHYGDVIMTIDRARTANCTDLKTVIVAHPAGDPARFEIQRGNTRIVLDIMLSTRADVLHRRFVGRPMESTDLVDVDDSSHSYDLGDEKGHTSVIAWFLIDKCVGCDRLLERVHDKMQKRWHDAKSPPFLLGVASTLPLSHFDPAEARKSFASNLPLAFTKPDAFEAFSLADPERASFMVIDCKGVVQFVAPIAPEGEDLDDAIAEVLSAADQAEHARTSRR